MKQMDLEEMFATCDIISIHLSSTPETYHMIDENLISKMKDGALLINTARGAIIDEKALVAVLEQKNQFMLSLMCLRLSHCLLIIA